MLRSMFLFAFWAVLPELGLAVSLYDYIVYSDLIYRHPVAIVFLEKERRDEKQNVVTRL